METGQRDAQIEKRGPGRVLEDEPTSALTTQWPALSASTTDTTPSKHPYQAVHKFRSSTFTETPTRMHTKQAKFDPELNRVEHSARGRSPQEEHSQSGPPVSLLAASPAGNGVIFRQVRGPARQSPGTTELSLPCALLPKAEMTTIIHRTWGWGAESLNVCCDFSR